MREIKFRAWHDGKHTKYSHGGTMLFVGDERGTTHPLDCCRYAACPLQGKHITLMQFTGLKDTNGVEIYEGDIVRDHIGVGEVQYSEIRGAFKVNYHDGFAKWFIDYTLKGERGSIEVIGNIHETPELLK